MARKAAAGTPTAPGISPAPCYYRNPLGDECLPVTLRAEKVGKCTARMYEIRMSSSRTTSFSLQSSAEGHASRCRVNLAPGTKRAHFSVLDRIFTPPAGGLRRRNRAVTDRVIRIIIKRRRNTSSNPIYKPSHTPKKPVRLEHDLPSRPRESTLMFNTQRLSRMWSNQVHEDEDRRWILSHFRKHSSCQAQK